MILRRAGLRCSNEWDRLKRQTTPPEPPADNKKKEYLQALTEKSQQWLKTWPDTVQGTVIKVAKKKERQRQRETAYVKSETQKQTKHKQNIADNILKARQVILESTSYGKELISAILESKTLEERELQIQFQKQIKREQGLINMATDGQFYGSESPEKEQQKRKIDREVAACNKQMFEDKNENIASDKREKIKGEIEDARLMKQLLHYEATERDHCEDLETEAIKEHEVERKEIRERKLDVEEAERKMDEVWNKYQDTKSCKEKEMFDQTHKDKQDSDNYKSNYSNLQTLQANQKQSYDDFVDIGIKKNEKRIIDGEQSDIAQLKKSHELSVEIGRENQVAAVEHQHQQATQCSHNSKCYCERQSLFTKSCGEPNRPDNSDMQEG